MGTKADLELWESLGFQNAADPYELRSFGRSNPDVADDLANGELNNALFLSMTAQPVGPTVASGRPFSFPAVSVSREDVADLWSESADADVAQACSGIALGDIARPAFKAPAPSFAGTRNNSAETAESSVSEVCDSLQLQCNDSIFGIGDSIEAAITENDQIKPLTQGAFKNRVRTSVASARPSTTNRPK